MSSKKAVPKKKETKKKEEDSNSNEEKEEKEAPPPPKSLSKAEVLKGLSSSGNIATPPKGKYADLLKGVKADGDFGLQLQALTELCELLSTGTEDQLSGFATDQFVPELVHMVEGAVSADIILLACRALAFLLDALPNSITTIVSNQAIPALMDKLLNMEYLDLAEQVIQVLEKLSYEHPSTILNTQGLAALLTFLDFFPLSTQRLCLNVAANICQRGLNTENVDQCAAESIEHLSRLLVYSDSRVVEKAVSCFVRFSDVLYGNQAKLENLIKSDTLYNILTLVNSISTPNQPSTNTPLTFSLTLRLLTNLVIGSSSIAKKVLEQGLANTLQTVLLQQNAGNASSNLTSPQLQAHASTPNTATSAPGASRPSSEHFSEILTLIHELLPNLPSDVNNLVHFSEYFPPVRNAKPVVALKKKTPTSVPKVLPTATTAPTTTTTTNANLKWEETSTLPSSDLFTEFVPTTPTTTTTASPAKKLSTSTGTSMEAKKDARDELYKSNPQLLKEFVEKLLPSIVDIFSSSINPPVKNKSLAILMKMNYYGSATILEEALREVSMSSFLAHLMNSQDPSYVASALKMAEILMEKLPKIFSKYFLKQGLVHQVDNLLKDQSNILQLNQPYPSSNAPFDIHEWIREHSATFKKRYFPTASSYVSDYLQNIHSMVAQFQQSKDGAVLIDAVKLLVNPSEEEDVSLFEVSQSGILSTLHAYLLTPSTSMEDSWPRILHFLQGMLTVAPQSFTSPSKPSKQEQPSTTTTTMVPSVSPLASLVVKLTQLFNSSEKFSLILNDLGNSSMGLKYLTQPFKFTLKNLDPSSSTTTTTTTTKSEKAEQEEEDVIHIEPLATIAAIQQHVLSSYLKKLKSLQNPLNLNSSSNSTTTTTTVTPVLKEDEEEDDEDQDDDSAAPPPSTTTTTTTTSALNVSSASTTIDSASAQYKVQVYLLPWSSTTTTTPSTKEEVIPMEVDGMSEMEALPAHYTIFQALQSYLLRHPVTPNQNSNNQAYSYNDSATVQPIHRLWEDTLQLGYVLLPTTTTTTTTTTATTKKTVERVNAARTGKELMEGMFQELAVIRGQCKDHVMMGGEAQKVLELLWLCYELNSNYGKLLLDTSSGGDTSAATQYMSGIPGSMWLNSKLSAKILRQIQDTLTLCSGAIPSWILITCQYYQMIVPYSTRVLLFHCTSMGVARSLQYIHEHIPSSASSVLYNPNFGNLFSRYSVNQSSELKLARIHRQKVRVQRDNILPSALKVMQLYGRSKYIIEVEYFGEVGTGLGPTLEFFTLVSRQLQRRGGPAAAASLWVDVKKDKDSSEYVFSPGGLFPALSILSTKAENEKALEMMEFSGVFIAKSMLDGRLLDLPLSSALLKWMIGKPLTLEEFRGVYPDHSIEKLFIYHDRKLQIQGTSTLSAAEKLNQLQALASEVEDLYLDFTFQVSQHHHVELKENGEQVKVTLDNLKEYVELVISYYLQEGVKDRLEAFARGFNSVIPMAHLAIFSEEEVQHLIGGSTDGAPWDYATLVESTRCDHGFSHSSSTVKYFLQVLTELDAHEQREFLLFVTGSPKLPVGGFKSLDPKLTIVRKEYPKSSDKSMTSVESDKILPSVNCCFYYLKLPEYSSKAVLKERLLFAIRHGQGSFSFN